MRRVELKHIAIRPAQPFAGWQKWVTAILTVLFFGSLLLVELKTCGVATGVGSKQTADGLLLLLAAGSTMAALSLQLPAQTVILGGVLIGGLTGLVEFVNGMAAVPLGPVVYQTGNVGRFLVAPLPWSLPVLWVVIVLNARGVARLILRPRRRAQYYGFWVLGVTVLLVVLFELSFQPYATVIKQFWVWKPTKLPATWYSTPWTYFLGCAVMTLLLLLFVTPALISKSPVPKPASFHPLVVWEALSLVFLTGATLTHLRAAWTLVVTQMIVIAVLALLGAGRNSRRA
jgi:hypothetical protein